MDNRIQWIDKLKGFLILLVIIGHFGYANYPSMSILHDLIYSFHMPLFIFLSGYVVTTLPFNKLIKRLRSLIIPFFVVGALFSLCNKGDVYSWLFMANKNYLWYLLILCYCLMILFPLQKLSYVLNSNNQLTIIVGGGVISLLLFVLDHVIVDDINNILSLHVLCVNFPFFILGHICRINSTFKSVLDKNITYTIATLSYIPLQLLYMRAGSFLFHGGAAICAIVVIIQLFQNMEFGTVGKGLAYFGSRTLDIYLYHGFVLGNC